MGIHPQASVHHFEQIANHKNQKNTQKHAYSFEVVCRIKPSGPCLYQFQTGSYLGAPWQYQHHYDRVAELWTYYHASKSQPSRDIKKNAKVGQTHLTDFQHYLGHFYGTFMGAISLKAPGNYSGQFWTYPPTSPNVERGGLHGSSRLPAKPRNQTLLPASPASPGSPTAQPWKSMSFDESPQMTRSQPGIG